MSIYLLFFWDKSGQFEIESLGERWSSLVASKEWEVTLWGLKSLRRDPLFLMFWTLWCLYIVLFLFFYLGLASCSKALTLGNVKKKCVSLENIWSLCLLSKETVDYLLHHCKKNLQLTSFLAYFIHFGLHHPFFV